MSLVPEDSATAKENGFRLLQAQRARKAAEEDAARLAVRVAQLEKEKIKSEKRIAETKKRTSVILQYRKRNEQTKTEKEMLNQERQAEIAAQNKALQEMKAEHNRRKSASATALHEAKREMTIMTKAEREKNEQYLQEQRLLERKAAMEQKDEVKRQQIEQQQRAALMKKKHLDSIRDNYELRLQKEMEVQAAKEKDLARMTKMELELINQLQAKQAEQKAAYDELEQALLGSGAKAGGGGGVNRSTDFAKQLSTGSKQAPAAANEPGEAEVQKAFASIDVEGTGTIPSEKLNDLMNALGIQLDEAQLSQATEQLDASKAGKISFGDFIMWWNG